MSKYFVKVFIMRVIVVVQPKTIKNNLHAPTGISAGEYVRKYSKRYYHEFVYCQTRAPQILL